MRKLKLDPSWEIPKIEIVLFSASNRRARANLVFDTGAGLTQLDIDLAESLGYSARDAVGLRSVVGPVGERIQGYIVNVKGMLLFGQHLTEVPVLVYDFKNFPGVDGLLGWDVIRTLHLELDGPKGILKVY